MCDLFVYSRNPLEETLTYSEDSDSDSEHEGETTLTASTIMGMDENIEYVDIFIKKWL